jgi:hypothetical protein
MGEEYVRFALENPAHYRLMYGREGLARGDVPELREAGNALFEQLVDVIQASGQRQDQTAGSPSAGLRGLERGARAGVITDRRTDPDRR